jgi:hypothetical protein
VPLTCLGQHPSLRRHFSDRRKFCISVYSSLFSLPRVHRELFSTNPSFLLWFTLHLVDFLTSKSDFRRLRRVRYTQLSKSANQLGHAIHFKLEAFYSVYDFIRNRIVICTFLTLYEGGKLTIPFYLYFPLLVSNWSLSALL